MNMYESSRDDYSRPTDRKTEDENLRREPMFAKSIPESLPSRMERLISQSAPNWDADKGVFSPLASFGAVVGTLRRRKGMDLDGLAQQSGLDSDDVLAIELGLRPLDKLTADLPALARALKVDPAVLFKFLLDVLTDEGEPPARPEQDPPPPKMHDMGMSD